MQCIVGVHASFPFWLLPNPARFQNLSRHCILPGLLKVVDSYSTEKEIFFVTQIVLVFRSCQEGRRQMVDKRNEGFLKTRSKGIQPQKHYCGWILNLNVLISSAFLFFIYFFYFFSLLFLEL